MDALVFLFPGVLPIKALGDFFLVILTELTEREARPPSLKILGYFSTVHWRLCSCISLCHACSEQKKPDASSKHIKRVSVQETFPQAVGTREAG